MPRPSIGRTMELQPLLVRLAVVLWLLVDLAAQTATHADRHGHRWDFAQPTEVGTFANGDPFVVGSTVVTAITPAPGVVNGRVVNGSMKNPSFGSPIGYDSGSQWLGYAAAANVALNLPLTLQPGDSLVSVESATTTDPLLKSAAVLTCVAARPVVSSFRPPYAAGSKPIYPTTVIRWENLVRCCNASFGAQLPALAAQFERLWLDGAPGWAGSVLHPADAMPRYSRDHTTVLGTMFLALGSDVPEGQKIAATVALMQYGIDVVGNVKAGWFCEGGQGIGRKGPVVFAALMGIDEALGINGICASNGVAPPHNHHRGVFGEDEQAFYVLPEHVGQWGYTVAHVGLPEWGNNAWSWPANNTASWDGNPYRKCCTHNAHHGQALVLRAMGGMQAWGWPAFFHYHDRYVAVEYASNDPDWMKAWDFTHWTEFTRLRQSDLPGVTTVGIAAPGTPALTVRTPPLEGQQWEVAINAGQLGVVAGILIRSRKTVLRPSRQWGPLTLRGLVFADVTDYEVSVSFTTDASGAATVVIPPAQDVAGKSYTLQAAVLTGEGLTPTNAAEVVIQRP